MIIRQTRPEEGRRVNELFSIAFELPMETGPADETNDRIRHWAAFADDGKTMMSTLSVSDYSIRFDGHACKMGGMGGAASLPQYRRRGGIRGCFQATLRYMYDNGYDFSYLYPFSTAYYRNYGYECGVRMYDVRLLLSLLQARKVPGELVLLEGAGHQPEVQALWERCAEAYNLTVIHGDGDFKWAEDFSPALQQEFTYLYRSPRGEAKGLVTCRLANEADGRNLRCSRFCFTDREGFDGLMNLLQSQFASHRYAKFRLPLETSSLYLFPEWALDAVSFQVVNAGMVRVVNARRVLELAKYRSSGEITIALRDGQLPENDGVFHVVFESGKAVSVEKTGRPADLTMDISKFSAAIAGAFDAMELSNLPGVEIHTPTAPLPQVFYQKPMDIQDYF